MGTVNCLRIGTAMVFAAAVLATPSWGCASAPKSRPVALDPSNPTAPEAAPLRVAALSPSPETPPVASQATGESAADGKTGKQPATIYTCPMHPEVISDKPGRCPKCGMKLVPKEPAEGKK
jgi:hypothetical protein